MALQQNQTEILQLINSIQSDLDRLRSLVEGRPQPLTGQFQPTRPSHPPPLEFELGPLKNRPLRNDLKAKTEWATEFVGNPFDSNPFNDEKGSPLRS